MWEIAHRKYIIIYDVISPYLLSIPFEEGRRDEGVGPWTMFFESRLFFSLQAAPFIPNFSPNMGKGRKFAL